MKVPDVDVFFWMSSSEDWERSTHNLNWLSDPRLSNLVELWSVDLPKFHDSIKTSRNQEKLIIHSERVDILDRGIMLTHSNWLLPLLLWIPSLDRAIWMGNKHNDVLLRTWEWCLLSHPTYAENWSLRLSHLSHWLYLWWRSFLCRATTNLIKLILLDLCLTLENQKSAIPTADS